MNTLQSDLLSAMYSQLDSDPLDKLTRYQLADLYEDLGKTEMADGQRWLIGKGHTPYFNLPYS